MSKVRISGLPSELYSPIADSARIPWDYPDGRTYKSGAAVMAAEVGRRAYLDPVATQIATIDPVTKKLRSDLAPWSTPETFLGFYDASTNTPTLADGTGVDGSYYRVNVAGNNTPDGTQAYVGDRIVYSEAQGVWKVIWDRKEFEGWRSVTDPIYGADPTGASESAEAFQAAIDAGPGTVYVPHGTYRMSETIELRQDVSIKADLGTVLDWSHNPSAADIAHCITYLDSSLTALPDLATSTTGKGAYQLTFASDPGLEPEDVIIAYNPTDSSFSSHRASYRDGDFLQVATEDGVNITLKSATAIEIDKDAFDFYKLSNPYRGTIEGLSVKGINDGSNSNIGIHIEMGIHVRISDCRFWNSSNTGISVYRCYGVFLDNVEAADNFENEFGFEYGLKILNSYRVVSVGCNYAAARHGWTTGTGGAVGDIPCRFCHISDSFVFAHTSQKALNFHGNSEHCIVANCVLDGGADYAGDYITFADNIIQSKGWDDKPALSGTEFKGFNFTITGNSIIQRWVGAGAADCFSTLFGMGALMDTGGMMMVVGNTFRVHADSDKLTSSVVKIRHAGYAGSDPIRLVISNNTIIPDVTYLWGINVDIEEAGSTVFDSIDIFGNTVENCALVQVTNSAGASEYSAINVDVRDNKVRGFKNPTQMFSIVGVRDFVEFTGNSFNDCNRYGIIQGVSSSIKTHTVIEHSNAFRNAPWGLTGSAELDSCIRFRYITNLIHRGINCINATRRLTVADASKITVGGTITGLTSGATATVYQIVGNDLAIKTSESATPFASGWETIRDDTTSNTTTSSAGTVPNQKFTYRIQSDVVNANRGHDIAYVGDDNSLTLSPSVAGVTNDVTTIS